MDYILKIVKHIVFYKKKRFLIQIIIDLNITLILSKKS